MKLKDLGRGCYTPSWPQNRAALAKAHQNQPFEKADCLTCHDPHHSDRPKLMQRFVHLPFGEKQCEVCHQPAKDDKVVLTQASAKELCVTCHAEHARHINDGFSCSACHTAHGMGGISGTISGERLVNFDVNVVAPNGATPISYSRASNSCSLTCHNANSLVGGNIIKAVRR